MLPKRVQVIKRHQIDVTGTVQLSPATGAGLVPPQFQTEEGQMKQARILESNQDYAVLEVVCGCGCRSRIQCDYINA